MPQIQGTYVAAGSSFYSSSAAEQVAQVKTGAGLLYSIAVTNFNAAARFLYVYDNTSSTGTLLLPPIPLTALGTAGSFVVINLPAIPFSTGLRIDTSSTGATFTGAGSDVRMTVNFK
jgi:hypothetical protein